MEHNPYPDSETEAEFEEDSSVEPEGPEKEATRETRKLPAIPTDFAGIDVTENERTMAALAHGSVLLMLLTGGFAGWIVPLVIWAVYRDKSRWVANQSLQALVFQVVATLVAYVLLSITGAAFALSAALMVVLIGFCMLPFAAIPGLLAVIVPLAATAYGLFGALDTYQGRDFQYWWVGDLVRDRQGGRRVERDLL